MKKILTLMTAILVLTVTAGLNAAQNGQPVSAIPGCEVSSYCIGDQCMGYEYTAPQGKVVCQVTVSSGDGYQDFTSSGQTPCGFSISGVQSQTVSIRRGSCETGFMRMAWIFTGEPSPVYSYQVYLPQVLNGYRWWCIWDEDFGDCLPIDWCPIWLEHCQ